MSTTEQELPEYKTYELRVQFPALDQGEADFLAYHAVQALRLIPQATTYTVTERK